jgi:GNAT superfamily N-acetyltransferase
MRSGAELDVIPPLELERMSGGELLAIRSAEADDDALLRDLVVDHVRARRQGRHLGWMIGLPHRPPRMLAPLTSVAALEECLLAIDPRSGRALGVAAIARVREARAIAPPWVLVRDGFRRRGIATALLERLTARARAHDYDRFRVHLVVSEQRMLQMMRGVGIACVPAGSMREVDAEVPIPGDQGLGVALGAALWAIARGSLVPLLPQP